MTDAPRVVRGAGKGAQWLSDRATKRGLPVRIAGLDFEGDRTTFNFGRRCCKLLAGTYRGHIWEQRASSAPKLQFSWHRLGSAWLLPQPAEEHTDTRSVCSGPGAVSELHLLIKWSVNWTSDGRGADRPRGR